MIVINNDKAIEITKSKIRAWREIEFKKNDIAIQNALVDSADMTALVARRDYLRDMPAMCNGKNIDELIAILDGLGE